MSSRRPREITVPPMLWNRVRAKAAELEISAAELARRAMKHYLAHLDRPPESDTMAPQ